MLMDFKFDRLDLNSLKSIPISLSRDKYNYTFAICSTPGEPCLENDGKLFFRILLLLIVESVIVRGRLAEGEIYSIRKWLKIELFKRLDQFVLMLCLCTMSFYVCHGSAAFLRHKEPIIQACGSLVMRMMFKNVL